MPGRFVQNDRPSVQNDWPRSKQNRRPHSNQNHRPNRQIGRPNEPESTCMGTRCVWTRRGRAYTAPIKVVSVMFGRFGVTHGACMFSNVSGLARRQLNILARRSRCDYDCSENYKRHFYPSPLVLSSKWDNSPLNVSGTSGSMICSMSMRNSRN
jgi:hypothetical protein